MLRKGWSLGRQKKSQKTYQSSPRTSVIFVSFCLLRQGDSAWIFSLWFRAYKMREKKKKNVYVFVCRNMCVFLCVNLDFCVGVCMCKWKAEVNVGIISQEPSTLIFETGVSYWSSPIRFDWLARKPQGSACLGLPSAGIFIKACAIMPSFWHACKRLDFCLLACAANTSLMTISP